MSDEDRVSVEVAGTLYQVLPTTAQIIEQIAERDDAFPADVTR